MVCVALHWIGGGLSSVAKGYPADKAGLQVGDFITPIDELFIIGDPGTTVTLLVDRKDKIFTIKVIRRKICTKDI